MRLVRFQKSDGEERIGVPVGNGNGYIADIQSVDRYNEPIVEFLAEKGSDKKVETAARNGARILGSGRDQKGKSSLVRADDVKILTPVRKPGKIICMGGNFSDHLNEGKTSLPSFPISFLKAPTALIGHRDRIQYPKKVELLDYEIELAVVVGERCKHVSRHDSLKHVAGFSVFNDISARDIQSAEMKRGFCNLGKNFDTFGPMGPYLVTPDSAGDPDSLKMELRVNGRTRQLSSTKMMVFKVRELIEFFSSMTLEPGDIITSGTPSGVAVHRKPDKMPYMLQPGDMVESEIENLGRLQNTVVEEGKMTVLQPSRVA